MFSESTKWILYLTMMSFGVTAQLTYILAQLHVKSRAPDLWERFFPDRSIGFAHDLKFPKFAKWYAADNGEKNERRLPWFWPLWRYSRAAGSIALVLSGLFMLDVGLSMYNTGMVGGWKFR